MRGLTHTRFPLLFALLIASLCLFPAEARSDSSHKPPPICIVLYLESQGPADEPSAPLLDLRDRLRSNERLEVLVFEPDSPTFVLAARNANPPISLDTVNSFDTRMALAQAVGARFAVMVAPTDIGSDHSDARIFEVGAPAQSWTITNKNSKDAAKAIANQLISAASQPAPPPASALAPAAAAPPPAPKTVPPAAGAAPVEQPAPAAPLPPVKQPVSTPSVTTPSRSAPSLAPASSAPPATKQTLPEEPAVLAPPAPEEQSAQMAAPQPPVAQPPVRQAPISPAPASPVSAQVPIQAPPATSQMPVNEVAQSKPTRHRNRRGEAAAAKLPPIEEPLITQSPLVGPAEGPSLDDVAQAKISQGDLALQQSDLYGAIQFYGEAVNAAPREPEPRMKLIQAYLQAGLKDQALDEERRALMIDPTNTQVQDLLKQQTADGTLPGADLAARQAATERDPSDESAWIALGDSYWNSGQPDEALQAYQKAARIAPHDVAAQAHLARLYAATSQYDKSLGALAQAGPDGYPYALRIIAARTDSLIANLEVAHDTFAKGNCTRESFYDSVKKSDTQAQELARFVAKITPPQDYEVAYLHRRLATNLLAQATAEWLSFIETNDSQFSDQAALLQSEAAQEMKTASIAERLQSSLSSVSH